MLPSASTGRADVSADCDEGVLNTAGDMVRLNGSRLCEGEFFGAVAIDVVVVAAAADDDSFSVC